MGIPEKPTDGTMNFMRHRQIFKDGTCVVCY
jgi:hypothetical protein